MAKSHDEFFADEHFFKARFGFVWCFKTLDQGHRFFVCASVQWTAQGANA